MAESDRWFYKWSGVEGARRPGEMISSREWSKPGISSLSLKIKGVGLGYKSGERKERMGFCQEPKHGGVDSGQDGERLA